MEAARLLATGIPMSPRPLRTLLPALLLLAAAAVPAAQALGTGAEAAAGDLPVPNPPSAPPCLSDEPNVVPFAVETVACLANSGGPCGIDPCCTVECLPVDEAIDYLQQVVVWLADYEAVLGDYAHGRADDLAAYVLALEPWLRDAILTLNGDALGLEQYLVCRLVSPGPCALPPLALPPPADPPSLVPPPLPPPPPEPWLLQ
jgi:hypothetical protein